VLFLVDRGGIVVGGGLLSVDAEAQLQEAVSRIGSRADLLVLGVVGLAAGAVVVRRWRNDRREASPGAPVIAGDATSPDPTRAR